MCLLNLWQGGPSEIVSPPRTTEATNTPEDIPQIENQLRRQRLSRTTESTNTPEVIPQTEN
jgi:hypothetical protein